MRQHDAVDEMRQHFGERAARIAGKAAVQVAAVDRRQARVVQRCRHVDRRNQDQAPRTVAGSSVRARREIAIWPSYSSPCTPPVNRIVGPLPFFTDRSESRPRPSRTCCATAARADSPPAVPGVEIDVAADAALGFRTPERESSLPVVMRASCVIAQFTTASESKGPPCTSSRRGGVAAPSRITSHRGRAAVRREPQGRMVGRDQAGGFNPRHHRGAYRCRASPAMAACSPTGAWSQAGLKVLEPLYRGENALEPERVSEKLHQNTFWMGRGGTLTHTISGIDIALWDILGKATGMPVGRLLGGGYRKRVQPYCSLLMEEPKAMFDVVARISRAAASRRSRSAGVRSAARSTSGSTKRSCARRARRPARIAKLFVDAGASDALLAARLQMGDAHRRDAGGLRRRLVRGAAAARRDRRLSGSCAALARCRSRAARC